MHELSRAISAFKVHPALKLQWCIISRVSLNRYASVELPLLVIAQTLAEVILKREPAPIKSQQAAVQAAEKDKCCLSGVHLVAVITRKASSFVPDG